MAMMKDTEGAELPRDDKRNWDITLWGDGALSLSIPMYLETDEGVVYSSSGVLEAPLSDLLQEYLDNHLGLDEGAGLIPLAQMMKDFASRYEAAAARLPR